MTNDLFDLTGRVAIVTGASRGLGQNFARALANAGADLVITSRNCEHLLAFESEIKSLGRRAVSLQLDVRDLSSIEQMATAAESAFGRLDILVNNAGCNVRKPALEVTWEDWNLVLDTNGQVVTANMTLVGLGTVTGRVLNPDNSSAPNLFVTVHSLDADFGGFQSRDWNVCLFFGFRVPDDQIG